VRAQLIEGAWQHQHRPSVGSVIAKRQQGVAPENTKSVVAAAVARELAGFLWAEMNAV
jgi:hypothetical protein